MHDRVVVRAPEQPPPEETMLKQTPLHAVHVAAGAKMVDFGGWDMPLHYGSQLEEHHAVRRKAGMFDVSHMRVVDLDGAASRDFLRTLIANDVAKLVPGKALYSCMLTESGTVIDDLIVYWMGADHYRIVVNAATADKDIAWMHDVQHGKVGPKRHFAVSLLPRRELAMIAVQGPKRGASCATSSSASMAMPPTPWTTSKPFTSAATDEFFIGRTGYTGEDGCEVVLPAPEAADLWQRLVVEGVAPCGLGARDTLRLEAGMALYGQDIDETVTPLESGLAWTVDMKDARAFIGRAALEAQQAAGLKLQLVGLRLARQGRAARAPEGHDAAGRGRDHQRHVRSHARLLDCAGARARGS